MRFANQRADRDLPDAIEHLNRRAQVIKDAEEQHQIEGSQPRVDVFSRAALVLDLRLQHLVHEQESVLPVGVPRVRVDREHALGAAPLAFKREEAVPRADVEDGLAREVLGNLEEFEPALETPADMPLRTGFDATQVEWVAPGNRVDALLKTRPVHYAQISASVGTLLFVITLPMRDTFIRCL